MRSIKPEKFEAWYPHFVEAQRGFQEIHGRIGRDKIIASNHAYFTSLDICRLATGFESSDQFIGERPSSPPNLEVDQIADFALARGLEVFDRIQARTDFIGLMIGAGILEDQGVVLGG